MDYGIKGGSMDYGMSKQETCAPSLGQYSPPSLTARLKAEQEHLKDRLSKVTDALNKLEAHPELQSILDAVQRIS